MRHGLADGGEEVGLAAVLDREELDTERVQAGDDILGLDPRAAATISTSGSGGSTQSASMMASLNTVRRRTAGTTEGYLGRSIGNLLEGRRPGSCQLGPRSEQRRQLVRRHLLKNVDLAAHRGSQSTRWRRVDLSSDVSRRASDPGRGQSPASSRPVAEHVQYAVVRSSPPKQMLVTSGSKYSAGTVSVLPRPVGRDRP